MVLLRFMCLSGVCRRARSTVRVAAPFGWLVTLLYCLLQALLSSDEWLIRPGVMSPSRLQRYELMSQLGFVPDPILYPHAHHQTDDLPVFIATVKSDDLHSFHRFLGSFRMYFRLSKLVVYDVGLTPEELRLIRHTCQCLIRTVHWERYPEHIHDETLKAYRPILIQETLREFGIVFWCNHEMRFNSSNFAPLRARAEAVGLVAWPSLPHPTSTYTHDGMLRYLSTDRLHFHFQRMVEPDSALYANTYRLHSRLLRPWVECALDPECIAPIGSRATGCDLTRRPRYRFSGCHRYDVSAFNVILGQMFYHDDAGYIPTTTIFTREVLPPMTRQSRSTDFDGRLKKRRQRTRSQSPGDEWEVHEADKHDQPILYKRRQ